MEEVAMRNLRQAARVVEQFWRQHNPRHLILAGAEPTVSQFRDLLPKALQERVVGTMSVDPGDTERALRERSLQVLRRVEEEREAATVEAVVTAAAKGKDGVVGLDETLSAAHEGRIRTLVVLRDFHAPGYRCTSCGYLTAQNPGACPFCGGTFAEIPDAAEAVVTKVVEDGGEIEVVDPSSATGAGRHRSTAAVLTDAGCFRRPPGAQMRLCPRFFVAVKASSQSYFAFTAGLW
jgi:rubrerythrin